MPFPDAITSLLPVRHIGWWWRQGMLLRDGIKALQSNHSKDKDMSMRQVRVKPPCRLFRKRFKPRQVWWFYAHVRIQSSGKVVHRLGQLLEHGKASSTVAVPAQPQHRVPACWGWGQLQRPPRRNPG